MQVGVWPGIFVIPGRFFVDDRSGQEFLSGVFTVGERDLVAIPRGPSIPPGGLLRISLLISELRIQKDLAVKSCVGHGP